MYATSTTFSSRIPRDGASKGVPLQGYVIAGDAIAAAYKYCQKQECQDLYTSSVAIMLREMQREVNMGQPFESKLRIDYSTNNHFLQPHVATDLDCCFMAILS